VSAIACWKDLANLTAAGPVLAAELEDGDGGGGGDVKAAHPPELRDEGDGVTGGERCRREAMVLVAYGHADVGAN
jgi:hypothetical protein